MVAKGKHSSLFQLSTNDSEKFFMSLTLGLRNIVYMPGERKTLETGTNLIKPFLTHSKLECFQSGVPFYPRITFQCKAEATRVGHLG
jgi:hypothetical protein